MEIEKKEDYGRRFCTLIDYVTKQYSWLCLLHGKVSQTGEQQVVRKAVGVSNSSYSSRNLSCLSVRIQNEGKPTLGNNVGDPASGRRPKLKTKVV